MMKRRVLNLLYLLIFPLLSFGQTERVINLQFNINDFCLTEQDGITYINSFEKALGYNRKYSDPALPYFNINVLIGANECYDTISVKSDAVLIKENVDLSSNPRPITTNSSIQSFKANLPVLDPISYPKTMIEYVGTRTKDGYQYLSFKFFPFRYDATTKSLFFNASVFLNLMLRTSDNLDLTSVVPAKRRQNPSSREAIAKIVVNAEDIDKLYKTNNKNTLKSPAQQSSIIGSIAGTEDYEYLIITTDSFKSAFQRLANWKTMKGVRTKVLTKQEIYQKYSTVYHQQLDMKKAMQIKAAIRDYYDNGGLKYVLLGGDEYIIPSLKCWVSANGTQRARVPVDLYYSCMGSPDWIQDITNTVYVNPFTMNLGADVYVTRASVENVTDINLFIDRTIAYEESGNQSDDVHSILMCGSMLYYYYQGKSDAQILGDSIYYNGIAPYSGISRSQFFDTYVNCYTGSSSDELNPNNLQYVFGQGHHFINIDAHGNTDSIKLETGFYDYSYAQTLTNPVHTIITTSSCYTNEFDNALRPSLSECFMRNPNSGIVGYVGCSFEGWTYNTPFIFGASDGVNAQFYKLLFTRQCKHFGETIARVKNLLPDDEVPTTETWLKAGINPLGDPEMPVYNHTHPGEFVIGGSGMDGINIDYEDGILTIQTNNDSCRICVMSKDDYGATYYAVTENLQFAQFAPPLKECSICITTDENIPFFATINSPVYIQNETISGNRSITTSKVYIGRNVTTQKSEGPVVLENGSLTIKSGENSIIKNNFTVQPGSKLRIN